MRRLYRLGFKLLPALAGAAWVLREWEKKNDRSFSWRRVLGGVLVIVATTMLITMLHVRSYYSENFTTKTTGCAVVFGAAVWRDDIPSHALDDRTQAALDLYKHSQVDCLVFSGGPSTYGAHEVAVMIKLATEAGVPLSDITPDWHGINTLATLLNLRKDRTYVLVSNDFHLARISAMAQAVGLEKYYLHAAPYQQGRYVKDGIYYWREVFGTLLVWLGL